MAILNHEFLRVVATRRERGINHRRRRSAILLVFDWR
jgi:hypothetical protein